MHSYDIWHVRLHCSSAISTCWGLFHQIRLHILYCAWFLEKAGTIYIVLQDRKLPVPESRLRPTVLQELLQSSGHDSKGG